MPRIAGNRFGPPILAALGIDPAKTKVKRFTLDVKLDEVPMLTLECFANPDDMDDTTTVFQRFEVIERPLPVEVPDGDH